MFIKNLTFNSKLPGSVLPGEVILKRFFQLLIWPQNYFAIMKHLAAYLLLGLGGNTSPSAADIKGVLESVGIDAEEDRLETLLSELKGKDLQEVYSQHSGKMMIRTT